MAGSARLSPTQMERGARMLFDRANPDVLGASDLDRDKWFADTYDYWLRACRDLVELLMPTMDVNCPCGWNISGPASEVSWQSTCHKCEKTDPWWVKHRRESSDYRSN